MLRAKWDAIRQLPAVLRDRRAVQRTRVVSDADLREVLDRTPLLARFRSVTTRQYRQPGARA